MSSDQKKRLRDLGLLWLSEHLDDVVALATKKRWGPMQFVEYLIDQERTDRARRSLERRLARSRIQRFKPMTDFDWNWPTRIDREAVESALRLSFVEGARNVVLVANQGLGKTTIAQNIAHNAVLAGHSVLFVTAAQMLIDLASQDSARALESRLKLYSNVGILIVDEVGYLSYDSRNADLFFQIVSRRYERKSIVLTTNLAFADWNNIFPNAACTTALIDRLVHRAEIIAIEGKSYRVHEAQRAAAERADVKKKSH
jgi:DNA replication protein DnaC